MPEPINEAAEAVDALTDASLNGLITGTDYDLALETHDVKLIRHDVLRGIVAAKNASLTTPDGCLV